MTHIFGVRSDSLDFHNYYQKFYDNIFFPYLIENNIKVVFQLGDLFDRRKYVNFNSLYLTRKYFFDKLKELNIQLHILLGNHCVFYKNTLEINSPKLLLKEYDNITIYDKFENINLCGIDIDIVPWMCDNNIEEIFNQIKESKSEICFGHFELNGFEMERGLVNHEGLDRDYLKKYDMVLTGHFHYKSQINNILYVGTPYEMTWADFNDMKGFHILDTETRDLTFVENPYKMFNKIFYDDQKQDYEYWNKYNFDSFKESYVKVIVVNKQNPYLFDSVIDNLYKIGLADLSIVEDFIDSTNNDENELVDQAEDTMTILNHCVDTLSLDIEKNKLKTIMREIYIEALNTEKTD